jgi:hypothetical protein
LAVPRRPPFAALALTVACLAALAAQKKPEAVAVQVKLQLPAKAVPAALKAGDRVDLKVVLSRSTTPTGKVNVRSRSLVDNLEVVSVKREEKPADPARAVAVVLRGTKEQADKVNKLKATTVTVRAKDEHGKAVPTKRPVPLFLELVKPKKEERNREP